jgi:hypothetical protein
MGDRLRVDLTLLDDTTAALGLLQQEFSSAGATVSGAREALGAHELVGALGDFAGNWDRHRKALLESIDAIRTMAATARDSYTEADAKLADGISRPPGGAPTGGRPVRAQ